LLPPEAVAFLDTERLTRARIAVAAVNTVTEFLDHPVLAGRDRWRTVHTEAGEIRSLLRRCNSTQKPGWIRFLHWASTPETCYVNLAPPMTRSPT
jgi:crotonobetainyl-CoA:carnitine CoA-transferase CaiB-like acyl-CoA transferase